MEEKPLVVVSTCDREPSYLAETLTSLEQAGATDYERWVLFDAEHLSTGAWTSHSGWNLRAGRGEGGRPSSRNNLWASFRLALEKKATRLLFFEDDVLACKNAVRWMAAVPIPDDAAMINCHDVKEIKPGSSPGLYRRHVRGADSHGIWGIQALILPSRTCEYLATCDPFEIRKSSLQHHGDRTLEHYLSISKTPYYVVAIPCVVKHVGEVSMAHPGKTLAKRQTSNWPGFEYDAMSFEST